MNITAILPVSRLKYLERVIGSLLDQTYKPTNLLVIVEGSNDDFIEVDKRLVTLQTYFDRFMVLGSRNHDVAHTIPDRRNNIVNIHNQIGELIDGFYTNTNWVFSLEDDGILPANALERLVDVTKQHNDVGMVTGVELGRWGVPYVGAWRVDDVNNPTRVESIENNFGPDVEEIDASGLYCALIRADQYKKHTFFTDNGLGPDVNLGLYLRRQGFKNYIDWGVPVTHLTNKDGHEIEIHPYDTSKPVKLLHLYDNVWEAFR